MSKNQRRKYWCEQEGLGKIRRLILDGYENQDIAKHIGISNNSFYRWRKRYAKLDHIVTTRGRIGINFKRINNDVEGVGNRNFTEFYRNETRVYFCHSCNDFFKEHDYVKGNKKCKPCNIKVGQTEQGKIEKSIRAKKYYQNNKDKVYELVYKRFTKQRNSAYNYSESVWRETLDWFENKCAYCGVESDELHREHVIPVNNYGAYVKSNIVPSCRACNSSKRDRPMEEWYIEKDYYCKDRHDVINEWTKTVNGKQQLTLL